jgi:hypothetical protein
VDATQTKPDHGCHPLRLAAALYLFDTQLLSLLGRFQDTARLAFHQIMLSVLCDPPALCSSAQHFVEIMKRGRTMQRWNAGLRDAGSLYLRQSFPEAVSEAQHRLVVARRDFKAIQVRVEHREAVMGDVVLRMHRKNLGRVVGAWRNYTVHCCRLRARYRNLFSSLSSSSVAKHAIRRWADFGRQTRIKKTSGPLPTKSKQQMLRVNLTQTLRVLSHQKHVKTSMLEAGVMQLAQLELAVAEAQKRLVRIASQQERLTDSLNTAIDVALPREPLEPFWSLREWDAEVLRADSVLRGTGLESRLLRSGGTRALASERVLGRCAHLIPIIRVALAMLRPDNPALVRLEADNLAASRVFGDVGDAIEARVVVASDETAALYKMRAERQALLQQLVQAVASATHIDDVAAATVRLVNKLAPAARPQFPLIPAAAVKGLGVPNDAWTGLAFQTMRCAQFAPCAAALLKAPTWVATAPSRRHSTSSFRQSAADPQSLAAKAAASLPPAGLWRRKWRDRLAAAKGSTLFAEIEDEAQGAVAAVVRHASRGGHLAAEIARLFDVYAASQPSGMRTEIGAEFMAAKCRTLFGRDSVFWRPVITARRTIPNVHEFEEAVASIAALAQLTTASLCRKMLAALTDVDLFFQSLVLPAVESAIAELTDVLVPVFELYARHGSGSRLTLSCDRWLDFNATWLDTAYTSAAAEEVFHYAEARNAELPDEIDYDGFCTALCMVSTYKIPSPFVPLERRLPTFVNTFVIPLGGGKVKQSSVSTRKESTAM